MSVKRKNKYMTQNDYACVCIERLNGEIVSSKIDNEIFEYLQKYHWHYISVGYLRAGKKYGYKLLHRIVYEFFYGAIPDSMQVDHVNGDTLDNRIKNLRLASVKENARNTRNRRLTGSGVVGVRKDLRCQNSWRSQIYISKNKHLEKTYTDKNLAIIQRLIWELVYFKEYAPQIELIRNTYPYLMSYLTVSEKMSFSDDVAMIEKLGDKLKSDPHCPCMIIRNEDTVCPCLPCREHQHCHCGMFVAKEESIV